MTRRSAIVAVVGLAFAAAAGVGLAQITAGPSLSSSAAGSSTTQPQSTGTQTIGGLQDESAEPETETDGDSEGGHVTTTSPLSTTTGEDQQGKGQEKVTMCHKTGSSKHPSHTIVIAAPAMPAHVAHGDTVGACAPTPATPPTQQEQKPNKQKPQKQPKAQKPAKAQKQAKQ